jgi:hypothetical protein
LDISTIASAGAMGVSIFCIIKVYDLLSKEQKKDKPRKVFLESINKFKVFAILMTLLSFGIEVGKHFMDLQKSEKENNYESAANGIVEKLNTIVAKELYAINSANDPEEIKLIYDNEAYILSEAYPKEKFREDQLKLKRKSAGEYSVFKMFNNDTIIFGKITEAELKLFASDIFVDTDKSLNAEDTLALGLGYAPSEATKVINDKRNIANVDLSVKYLIDIINLPEDKSFSPLKKIAIKPLVQPSLMNNLDPKQYNIVIKALEGNIIRRTPWRLWDLSQVYLSRSLYSEAPEKSDKTMNKNYLKEYVAKIEELGWDTMRNDKGVIMYPEEKKLYNIARGE